MHLRGRCMTMELWVGLTKLCRFVVVLFALVPLATGSLEWWADRKGGQTQRIAGEVRDWIYVHGLLSFERSIGYVKGYTEPDLVLLASALLIVGMRRPLGALLSGVLQVLFGWFLAKKIEITISAKRLVVHRWWWNLKLSRERGAEVQVRCVKAEEYFSPCSPTELAARGFVFGALEQPPAVVEIVHGLRRHKLLMARHEDRAEAIVARCNEALAATDTLIGLS